MKLKVTLRRSAGPEVDLVITADAAAPVGAVAEALLQSDPLAGATGRALPKAPTLAVLGPGKERTVLERDVEIGEAAVASGATVAVVEAGADSSAPSGPRITATVVVVRGPDEGLRKTLGVGTHYIGRDPSGAMVLKEPWCQNVMPAST